MRGIPRGKIRSWDVCLISIRVELGQAGRMSAAFCDLQEVRGPAGQVEGLLRRSAFTPLLPPVSLADVCALVSSAGSSREGLRRLVVAGWPAGACSLALGRTGRGR
jgi:hypothetical protein